MCVAVIIMHVGRPVIGRIHTRMPHRCCCPLAPPIDGARKPYATPALADSRSRRRLPVRPGQRCRRRRRDGVEAALPASMASSLMRDWNGGWLTPQGPPVLVVQSLAVSVDRSSSGYGFQDEAIA